MTERFNQDPVEIYFGQQRARGHVMTSISRHPMYNTQAIIIQNHWHLEEATVLVAKIS